MYLEALVCNAGAFSTLQTCSNKRKFVFTVSFTVLYGQEP